MAPGQANKDDSDSQNTITGDKKKDHTPSKVVIRRLPPTLTPEEFLEQVSPLPDYDFFYFVRADMSLGSNAFTRAYINFLTSEDIFIFRDKFDGYVFLDAKGGEYPAIVEFSPFQKVPKKKPKKVDAKAGLIEQDSDYKKFLDNLAKPVEAPAVSLDAMVVEVEAKESMLAKSGSAKITTPLLEYLRRRREERKLNIAKLKEERRRGGRDRDLDRKLSGKEESEKRKSEKDRLRDRDRERRRERNNRVRERDKDRKKERNTQKVDKLREERSGEKRWQKEGENISKPAVMLLKNTDRESQNSDKRGVPERKGMDAQEKTREEKETLPDNQLQNELGKEEKDRKRDDRRGKRGGGGGRWTDTREDERYRHPGGKERGRGSEEERGKDRQQRDKGPRQYRDDKELRNYRDDKDSKSYRDDKDKKSYREEREPKGFREDRPFWEEKEQRSYRDLKEPRRNRPHEERGGGDRYSGKERGGGGSASIYGRDDRGGTRDRYREDRGGSDRRGGGGDGWKKKDSDAERRKTEKDKVQEKRAEPGKLKGKEDGKKEGDGTFTRRENTSEGAKDDKEKSKEEERAERGGESNERKPGRPNAVEADVESSTSKQGREEEEEERGASTERDEKKRKRKERPERQIYIPRKALERQRQGSPQIAGKSDDKASEPS